MILLVCSVVSRQGHLNVERNVSTAYCKSSSGDEVDWFWHGFIYHGGLLWLVHFNPAIVSIYHGLLRCSLIFCASLVSMFFYCRHPRFRYFGSVVPVYVVWAESCVNCLFHFPCVPMAFSVNKLITLDKWFETTFLPIVDNWVKWKYFLGIIIKRIKFKLLDQSYFFSALRSGIFRT